METTNTCNDTISLLENLLFGDFYSNDSQALQILTHKLTRQSPSLPIHSFCLALNALYQRDAVAFSIHIQCEDETLLVLPLYQACRWIHSFRMLATTPFAIADFWHWLEHIPEHVAIFTLAHVAITLRQQPQFLELLRTNLDVLTLLCQTSTHPVRIQAYYYLSALEAEIFDTLDVSLAHAFSGFKHAQAANFVRFELNFLNAIAYNYETREFYNEAITYYLRIIEHNKQSQFDFETLALTYFNLVQAYMKKNEVIMARYYLQSFTRLIDTAKLTAQFILLSEFCELMIQTRQKNQEFSQLWEQYVDLSAHYLQVADIFQLSPMEPLLLELEAELHEIYTHDYEQLLCTYFSHLAYVQTQTPNKKLVLATLYKKIAVTYKRMQAFDSAWEYYQHYHEQSQLWRQLKFTLPLTNHDTLFEHHFQTQKLAQLQTTNRSLQQSSRLDFLTKLYSRHYLEFILTKKQPSAYALIDIDHFKKFNDAHGHQNGDVALQTISKAILTLICPDDCAIRYGGEEILIVSFATDSHAFTHILQRLTDTIAHTPIPLIATDDVAFLTVSIGATFGLTDFTSAFSNADQALYHVKNAGRNDWYLHQNE